MKTRNIKKYLAFTKAGILDGFAYKFNAFGWLLGDFIAILILFFLWQAVYNNSYDTVINNLTFSQMVTYLIFARIVSALIFSTPSFWIVGEDIYEGNIAISMTKPINYRYRVLFTSFGMYISNFILLFIPLILVASVLLYLTLNILPPSILMILLFIISSVFSLIICDTLNFLVGQMAIFTNALFGLLLIKNVIFEFLAGTLLPIAFFPLWLQKIADFLPFTGMIQTPVMILTGQYDLKEVVIKILVQILWVVILNIIVNFTFNKIKKHIVSVGG